MKDSSGMRVQERPPSLTRRVDLPGGQDRLRQMILYIACKCAHAGRMGQVKLNKILWRADFEAYAARRVPVTGRAYQRLELGPAPQEMVRVLNDMLRDQVLRYEETDFGDGVVEKRPIAEIEPNLSLFNREDLEFVDAAIGYYWDKTGTETSDDSHGIAWRTRENGDPMYYELAYLSDEQVSPSQRAEVLAKIEARKARSHRTQ